VDIARDLLDFGGAFFEIQLYVAVDIFHRNVAVLAGDLDFSVAAGDGYIALAPNDVEFHFSRKRNVQVALHGVVAGGVSPGVENDHIAGESNLGLGLPIVLIGVALTLRAHAFANYHGDFIVIRRADANRPRDRY